ncbi:hypothetical protein F4778DRAFT_521156 [Xylariomycetidae sp. FL2044]|nr:hypothetical protein F4778DRAFT_521156 [Xylariomycetidae sp. FL2044]
MAIPQFPNESVAKIISYLAGEFKYRQLERKRCYRSGMFRNAAVSKSWQDLVERYTSRGSQLTFELMDDATRILQPPRRKFVRKLAFSITLDSYDEKQSATPESRQEQETNQWVFSRDIAALFRYLSTWNSTETFNGGIELSLSASSPGDALHTETGRRKHWV